MHYQIVCAAHRLDQPAPTKLHLWQAQSSKLWTGETDIQTGNLIYLASYILKTVTDPDEIPIQCTCHTNTGWYYGGWEGKACSIDIASNRGLKSSKEVALFAEKTIHASIN